MMPRNSPLAVKVTVVLLALVAVVAWAEPASAQNNSRIFGVVSDAAGQPVPDVSITLEFQGGVARKHETKTNRDGSFTQVGLTSGPYTVTATKDGIGGATGKVTLRAGQSFQMNLQLLPPGAANRETLSEGDRKRVELLAAATGAFKRGLEAVGTGSLDEAVKLFNEALEASPTCGDCHRNLGIVFTRMKDYARAESAFKQALALQPDDAASYAGLAEAYNAQRKFAEAGEANAQAAKLKGGPAAAGGNAAAVFDQGLILWNAGKVDEARQQFEETLKLDSTHAEAHYWLGMANLNAGKVAEAAAELKLYLDRDPKGRFAAQATGIVKQLQP